tara:strand:+ start:25390 stop:25512 length:123 start_codon:yes stop_codon:yes gene_type:complete
MLKKKDIIWGNFDFISTLNFIVRKIPTLPKKVNTKEFLKT